MTTELMPTVEVTGPPVVPYPFGLFSVAPVGTPADGHWTSGIWWRSFACNLVGVTYGPCSVDDEVPEKDPNVECGIGGAVAFTVYARSDESVGGGSLAEKFQAARDTLIAGEQFAVEQTVWAALLAEVTVADGTAGAQNYAEAVAMAEALIADNYGGSPVLHMSRFAAPMAHDVIQRDGTRLATLLGSQVVAGGGYGTSPTTAGAAQTIFATGALQVVRGEIFDLGQHLDRDTNSISAVVERTYVVGWDCTAVRVAIPAAP